MSSDKMIEGLEALLPAWFDGQRWFSASDDGPKNARIVEHDILRDAWPKLLWTLVEVDDDAVYQVLVGLREADNLGEVVHGNKQAYIGTVPSDDGELAAYDALIDPVLGRVLFDVITDGSIEAKSVRPVTAEQSNTSLIFDNRYILKMFRRLYEGRNPDLEVTMALTDANFKNVAPVVATWQRKDWDLAVCVPYLWDGSDGWKLALGSIRDFLSADTFGSTSPAGSSGLRIDVDHPDDAGGDLGQEARRLGEVTGNLHIALAQQFGAGPFDPSTLVSSLESGLSIVEDAERPQLAQLIERVRGLDPTTTGQATRIHGDYHLGQTLRSVSGWYIFDFEGEPARPLTERVRASSPFKDVTGMFRSFGYAAAAGLFERLQPEDEATKMRAGRWERRNREAFWSGYIAADGIESLLPSPGDSRDVLLRAFEVEKAIYELGYEKAYRPDWVAIPQGALANLLQP